MKQEKIQCPPAEVNCNNGAPVRYPGMCCRQCGKQRHNNNYRAQNQYTVKFSMKRVVLVNPHLNLRIGVCGLSVAGHVEEASVPG